MTGGRVQELMKELKVQKTFTNWLQIYIGNGKLQRQENLFKNDYMPTLTYGAETWT